MSKTRNGRLVLSSAQKTLWVIPQEDREVYKEEAWAILNDPSVGIPAKAMAVLRICEMHYHRMITGLTVEMQRLVIGRKHHGYILDLDTYTSHWLAANNDFFSIEVGEYILTELHCKPERCKYMPSGYSSYAVEHVGKPFKEGFGRDDAHFFFYGDGYKSPKSPSTLAFEKGQKPMIEFFKNGDALAIRTDAQNETEFFDGLAEAITQMASGEMKNDLEYHLRFWLPQAFEILCKLRGYKADVQEKRVLMAGARFVPEMPAIRVGRDVETQAELATSKTA